MRTRMLVLALAALATLAAASHTLAGSREVGDLGKVGTVRFPTACDPAVQKEFERGLALLHSFFYDEARRVFQRIAEQDPECAMAHWGVAMTFYHPIWTAPDSLEMLAGTAAAERALAAAKQGERERDFVRAIAAYYLGPWNEAEASAGAATCHGGLTVDPKGRAAAFRREMERLYAARPDDVEAAAYLALSLLATHPPTDATLANPKRAAAILETWYAKNRNHPGLVHYLIHSYDYPPLAAKGLRAARAYAQIAPWVPHALHMPSHIFTRLGMWKESIESNLASAEASRRYGADHHPHATASEELHALDYALYGYLQTAQDEKARELMARVGSVEKTHPAIDFAAAYAFGAMPARFALERRQWKEAAALPLKPMPFWDKMSFAEGHIVYARAVGAAKSGDLEGARAAAARLEELSRKAGDPRFKYFADQMEIQRQAALALVSLAEGRREEAVAALRAAAEREDLLGKHPVSPGAMLPVRELLGDALLETGDAAGALAAFGASLEINPGRFAAIYGAARSAAAAGKNGLASRYYAELRALASAEDTRPELAEAREFRAGR